MCVEGERDRGHVSGQRCRPSCPLLFWIENRYTPREGEEWRRRERERDEEREREIEKDRDSDCRRFSVFYIF